MNAKDALRSALNSSKGLLGWYLSDLSDADLLVRPVPNANHVAWQVGHLIVSEQRMGTGMLGGSYPELPAGFAEQHAQDRAGSEDKTGWGTREEYLRLFNQTREATLAHLNKLADADLDRKTEGRMASFAPTWGDVFILVGNHTLMHAGQFTPIRRKLGKPVLF